MFGLGLPEILVILVIIFLLFGAKRIPEIGEGLGKTVREIRKLRDEKRAGKKRDKIDQTGSLASSLKREVDGIPGLKEAREIQATVDKVRGLTKILK